MHVKTVCHFDPQNLNPQQASNSGQVERVWRHDELEQRLHWYENYEWIDLWNMASFMQVSLRKQCGGIGWCVINLSNSADGDIVQNFS